MTYQIIGWTSYDDEAFETAPPSSAAEHAIIDEIRAHGYRFTGYHHQESPFCVPVLNDGKKRLFSQRGFGELMARAHRLEGIFDYAAFSYPRNEKDNWSFPTQKPNLASIRTADTLSEAVTLPADAQMLAAARHEGLLSLDDREDLRFLDRGDRLILQTGNGCFAFTVTQVTREKKLSEDEWLEIDIAAMNPQNKTRLEQANALYKKAQNRLLVQLSK